MSSTPTVMFVCSQNSARSQMAEGLLRHLAGDRFHVYSAGIDPGQLNPLAVEAMNEIGMDISGHEAQGIKKYLGHVPVSYLIIVCDRAAKACPSVWPGIWERFIWPFEDPAAATGSHEDKLAAFCKVRDQIKAKLEHWLEDLDTKP